MNQHIESDPQSRFVRILIRRPITILFMLLICALGLAIYFRYARLHRYQEFITREYADEIAAIEDAARSWPESPYENDARYVASEKTLNKIKQTLNRKEFHWASWSYDGHHGLKSLIIMPDGIRTSPIFEVSDRSGQSLRYGETFGGEPLLVFQKWIPGPQTVHHIKIVFNRREIDSRMADEESQSSDE